MIETIPVADVLVRWSEMALALRSGKQEFLLVEGQTSAVIVDPDRYRRLVAAAEREERRRRTLDLAMPAAASPTAWGQGFAALEDVREKFAGLSDDDLDALFGEVSTEVRRPAFVP
jgi:hypothetical protein